MQALFLRFRALFYAFFAVTHTLACSLVVITMLILRLPRRWSDLIIRPIWCGGLVRMASIQPQIRGVENIPRDQGFLFLFTHSSHLDVPILVVCSPKSFRFGAKADLFKIPFFSMAMRLAGTLPIAREDRSQVMEVYRQAQERLARGEAFALAPEGGRRKGTEILDFKTGPFEFAMNAHAPIVPVVLYGVDQVLEKGHLLVNHKRWSNPVGVSFLASRQVPQMDREGLKRFKESLRTEMIAEYRSLGEMIDPLLKA